MTALPLSREDRIMKDPKKQAQAQAQAQKMKVGKQGRVSVDAAIKISDEQPVLRLIFNNRRVPDELYGVKCGGGVRILEYGHDFEASYVQLSSKLSLKEAINLPEDGIL